ncbi:MAG: GNAT family N-acetyltransferase [Clostridia bacterium]|nr:GNAT family N-acetyltransferase [Clostridia bacterium]
MAIQIEKACADDADKVLRFAKLCGAETDNLSFGAEGLPLSVEEEARFLASLEHSETGVFYLAKDGEEIVGSASYSVFPRQRMSHRGELGISVRKSHWNQGVGTALMEHILDFAKNVARSEILSLEVRSDQKNAIRLYSKFGFQKIGTFKGFFKINGQLVDFDLMELIL